MSDRKTRLPYQLRNMRMLEEEDARLERLVADLTLDRHILQELLRKIV